MLKITNTLLGVLFGVISITGIAEKYPDRPIRMIVPYVAGGSYDTVARIIANQMSDDWQRQVIVDNRPGGTGILGTELIAKAMPDGYTIGFFGGNQTLAPIIRATVPYDIRKDFVPITRVALLDNIITVNPSVPVKNLTEFIALLKNNPGKYNYGTGGAGGDTHFASALFTLMAGVRMIHVPYRGGGLAVTGLLANEVQMMVLNIISAATLIKTKRLRGLAMAAQDRSPILPDIPTTAEAGLPGYKWNQWYGIVAPAGTPRNILEKIHTEIKRVISMPTIESKFTSLGIRSTFEAPQDFAVFLKQNIEANRQIANEANIRVE